MSKIDPILNELAKPFHPSDVAWKPGSTTKDGKSAMALAYADLRAYQNRLDEVCGMNWSCTYTPWGDKLVAHVTIGDVTRSSTGEPDSQSERSEIAGTSAEAQAFKRACAMFGLGRYIYNLPSQWIEFDAATKKFTQKGLATLAGVVMQHYKRAMAEAEDHAEVAQLAAALPGSVEVAVIKPAEEAVDQKSDNWKASYQVFDLLGQELYGNEWGQVCCHNVERITVGKSSASNDLSFVQLTSLIDGMKKLKAKRVNAVVKTPIEQQPAMAH